MDFGHIEPGRVRGDDHLVRLLRQVLSGLVLETRPRSFELSRVLFLILFAGLALFLSTFDHVHILFVFEWSGGRLATCSGFEWGKVPNLPALYRLEFAALPRSIFGVDRYCTLSLLWSRKQKERTQGWKRAQATPLFLESQLLTSRKITVGTEIMPDGT